MRRYWQTRKISANPDGMTEVSAKMVEIAHQISIANANKAPMVTNIPAPGKDSVSALLARFFNARGDLYRVHTDRGADIGKRLSWSLKDGASKYADTDESGKKDFLSDRSGGRDAYVRRTGVHAPYNEDIPKGVPAPYTSDEDDGAGVFPRSEKHIFLSHSDDEYSD
ncbi:PE family protein [Mycobacterium haemophilum]